MKFDLISDIHLEFDPADADVAKLLDNIEGERSDTLLIAGDICPLHTEWSTPRKAREFFKRARSLYKNVYYVLGNHDYWMQEFNSVVDEWTNTVGIKPLTSEDVVTLEDDLILVGDTLWSDISPDAIYDAKRYSNDYKYIFTEDNKSIHPHHTIEANHTQFANLEKSIAGNSDKRVIVLTHHAPSESVLSRRNRIYGNNLTSAYCNRYDGFLETHPNVVAWCYGHLHESSPNDVYNTKMYTNPRGYIGQEFQAYTWKIRTFTV